MTPHPAGPRHRSRREVLQLGGGAALLGLVGACSSAQKAPTAIRSDSPQVRAYAEAEERRFPHGASVAVNLTAAPADVSIAGTPATAWLYNGQLPGPVIRANVGDRVTVRFKNQLPESTTVHWHGLAIRNDMDGVPDVTQPPVTTGTGFTYDFIPPDPGTYWYHTHADLQRGRGLYGALIVDDPSAPAAYDTEFIVVLSEWLNKRTPEQVFAQLRGTASATPSPSMAASGMAAASSPSPAMTPSGMAHPGMTASASAGMGSMGGSDMTSPVLGGDAGDVRYPVYLLNGKPPQDPAVFTAKSGQRVRIRIINAGDDTTFRVALGGHRMTVIGTDGFPVQPVTTDSVLVSMGERYDAIVTLQDGAFPLVASAEGKGAQAFAVVRTAAGAAPSPATTPKELTAAPLTVAGLRATDANRLPAKTPDVTVRASLDGNMARYVWTINNQAYPQYTPLNVHANQRVRLVYTNTTAMYHPMHLHGHTFAVARPNGQGPRKDTVIVLPGQTVATDFDTDNPGQWITHCHNDYHLAAGMATIVSYVS
jgi:multicopper oxidase